MIAIIDYGVGNVAAFYNLYNELSIPVFVAREPGELNYATKIILPGVGAFDYAMSELNKSQFRDVLDELVLVKEVPILGVCVGMQMLAGSSDEGVLPGFGWIEGVVRRLTKQNRLSSSKFILPHMGWNNISISDSGQHTIFNGLDSKESLFYFLHSYYFSPQDNLSKIAEVDYFGNFCCAIQRKNIFGVQFHPEKSHQCGKDLLKNFANL